jgi:hypothetical protein
MLAQEDPQSFLKSHTPPVIFDEIQRVPQLLSYIQVEIDKERDQKGMYILTGSHQTELCAGVSQSLSGRTAIVNLLPLSISELSRAGIQLDRDEYLFRGFMPQIYREGFSPTEFYRQYYHTYVERDIRQLANIRNMTSFENFFRLLAGRVGQVINMSALASATGMSVPTIKEWFSVLEASYLIFRLPPYYKNFGKRLIKSPKLYFTEPGLAAYLLGIREPKHISLGPFLGALFENMLVMEALKGRYNEGDDANLYFYRDNNGLEADLLLDRFSSLLPIEIKASRTFSKDFCNPLQDLRKIHPTIKSGIVLYAGALETEYKGFHIKNFIHTFDALKEQSVT